MKIFISYNFLSNDKESLKKKLIKISKKLEDYAHSTFIHWRDIQNWGETDISYSPRQIIQNAFHSIDTCDTLLAFTETSEKSQGMLLEIGYAYAKGKKIFLATVGEPNLRYVESFSYKVLKTDSFDVLVDKLEI